jgi:hypothetical protein
MVGASSVVSWAVRVDDWSRSALLTGVMCLDSKCVAPVFGANEQGFGVCLGNGSSAPRSSRSRGVSGRWESANMPPVADGTVVQVRMAADLTANTARFAVEHVPSVMPDQATSEDSPAMPLKRIENKSWVLTVPDLQRCHFYVAGGYAMRLTLMV